MSALPSVMHRLELLTTNTVIITRILYCANIYQRSLHKPVTTGVYHTILYQKDKRGKVIIHAKKRYRDWLSLICFKLARALCSTRQGTGAEITRV